MTEISKHVSRKTVECIIAAESAGYNLSTKLFQDHEYLVLAPLNNIVTWLRKQHHINVWVERGERPGSSWFAVTETLIKSEQNSYYKRDHSPGGFVEYPLALCDGIERALKMIEELKAAK